MVDKKTAGIGKGTPGPGRPKNTPNKITRETREMVQEALSQLGGAAYLVERGKDPKTASAFLTLVGKTIATKVEGAGPNGEHVFQRIVVEVVKPEDE